MVRLGIEPQPFKNIVMAAAKGKEMSGSTVISIVGSNGVSIACQILDIFELDDQEYALLMNLQSESLVVMRLAIQETESKFQEIDSDEEYKRVVEHVQFLAKQNSDEESE